ncbi:DNA adenine methylase [Clostridium sp. BJN0013]|uniref:DNA adenine methylase n=1 Tax=Clostridium sp. BJN0013 TaxID=3236840 RepID=UPI0034C65261
MKFDKLVAPVVKWVGGKRQLLPELEKYIPENISTYYEPFVGGGAVLFHIQPEKAVVSDINEELINLYMVIKNNVEELIEDLKKHKNTSDYFYMIRELDRKADIYSKLTKVERASRIHYLNKTCYNGLFRVNILGQFNSPFGNYKNPNIINEITIRAVNKYLNEAEIELKCCDYGEILGDITKGAFVYLDPPYDPVSSSANFTGYVKGRFNKDEQSRLKSVCDKLTSKGVRFLLSNSSTDFILNLYKDYNIEIIQAKRSVNSNGNKRGKVDEVLVRNYD